MDFYNRASKQKEQFTRPRGLSGTINKPLTGLRRAWGGAHLAANVRSKDRAMRAHPGRDWAGALTVSQNLDPRACLASLPSLRSARPALALRLLLKAWVPSLRLASPLPSAAALSDGIAAAQGPNNQNKPQQCPGCPCVCPGGHPPSARPGEPGTPATALCSPERAAPKARGISLFLFQTTM